MRLKSRLGGVVFIWLALSLPAPGEDFPSLFGSRYGEAEGFLSRNAWIAGALDLPPLETRIATAVVFPEIVRFRALEDKIAVRALKVLYVQYGRKYADFSIGHFQMKPSFAEQVERDFDRLFSAGEKAEAGEAPLKGRDNAAARAERVRRLDDLAGQVRYLRMFMLVMNKMHGSAAFRDDRDRLRFYAAAYNSGYGRSAEEIRRKMTLRNYHLQLIFPAELYSYTDVAESYYNRRFHPGGENPPDVPADRPTPMLQDPRGGENPGVHRGNPGNPGR
ncbi:MAG TPA: hypothetical protein PLX50_04140 [Candidatus Aminicenantes bacterium]|nr:hypothetical protein [Candidatus Aminicenantes bacterium]